MKNQIIVEEESHIDATIFPATNVYSNGLKRLKFSKNGIPLAYCYLYKSGKLGSHLHITPPFHSDINFNWEILPDKRYTRLSLQKEVIQAFANYLKNNLGWLVEIVFPYDITDIQPFIWNDFKPFIKYNYELDLTRKLEEIKSDFSDSRKRNIKSAIKNELRVIALDDVDTIANYQIKSLQDNGASFNDTLVREWIHHFIKNDAALCQAIYIEESIAAMNFCSIQGETVHYNFGYADKKLSSIAGTYLLYDTLVKSKELGLKKFDFEGSMIPSIEKYFRSFGGKLVARIGVKKSSKAWQLKSIVKP